MGLGNYYTKAQMEGLLEGKVSLSGTRDIEITDNTKGIIVRASGAERIRIRANVTSAGVTFQTEEVT